MADEEEVGVIHSIQQEARELLRIALQCNVGAGSPVEAGLNGERDLPLLVRLKREKEALLHEFIGTKVELYLRGQLVSEPLANVSISENSVEELQESNHALQDDLLSVRLQYLQDRRVLECLQTTGFLGAELFPKSTAGTGEKEESRFVCSLVDKHTSVCSDVMKNTSELKEVEGELDAVRRERAEAQDACRQLMTRLQELKQRDTREASISPEEQSLRERLDRLSAEATLLRHTLQSLVVGSGADWSSGDLMNLMIRLGSRFDWQ